MSGSTRVVVVGTDGSPTAVAAIDWAAAEANRRGAELEILHASALTPGVVGMDTAALPAAADLPVPVFVEEARNRVGVAWPHLIVRVVQTIGGPAYALISRSEHADLMVVGSHGQSALSRLLLGSVSHHVAGHARCPVVVVRGEPQRDGAPVAVGIDDSPNARLALEQAFDEAAMRGVPLVAFHAWQEVPVTGYGVWAPPPELDDELRVEAEGLVRDALVGWPEKYPQVEVHALVEHAHPVTAAVEQSERAQLLVLGAHGTGFFHGMTTGSLPSAAVRECRCPVLVVRPCP